MKAPSRQRRRTRATSQPLPKFKCVVVYEDPAAGERGERFRQKLVAAMQGDCVSTPNLWSFSVLAIPEMRNLAASAAAVADIVIVALSEKPSLPAKVKEWMEMWLWLIDDARPAMAVLFAYPNEECGPIRSYLRSLTASKQLDFFPDSTLLPSPFAADPLTRKSDSICSTSEAWRAKRLAYAELEEQRP
ncbi:MAG: hypothetical protein QOE70_6149 [Chthoniobacter sp.]|jgi:hypothetical protein|nr:hypothetical protein [Chthoniobacter sp.]